MKFGKLIEMGKDFRKNCLRLGGQGPKFMLGEWI